MHRASVINIASHTDESGHLVQIQVRDFWEGKQKSEASKRSDEGACHTADWLSAVSLQ